MSELCRAQNISLPKVSYSFPNDSNTVNPCQIDVVICSDGSPFIAGNPVSIQDIGKIMRLAVDVSGNTMPVRYICDNNTSFSNLWKVVAVVWAEGLFQHSLVIMDSTEPIDVQYFPLFRTLSNDSPAVHFLIPAHALRVELAETTSVVFGRTVSINALSDVLTDIRIESQISQCAPVVLCFRNETKLQMVASVIMSVRRAGSQTIFISGKE